MVEPLPANTALLCGYREYVLQKEIARGGRSIVYAASQTGSKAMRVIKEACPCSGGLVRRGTSIVPWNPDDQKSSDDLKRCRDSAMEEIEQAQIIDAISMRTVCAWDVLHVEEIKLPDGMQCEPDGGIFSILPDVRRAGQFLFQMIRQRQLEEKPFSAHELATMAYNILTALGAMHENNYIHGDLSTGNVFFENSSEENTLGEAFLFDLGSAQHCVLHEGESELSAGPFESVYSSSRFSPPEMHRSPIILTPKSDVYSAAALILAAMGLLGLDRNPHPLDNVAEGLFIKIGASPAAASQFMAFLQGCLETEPEKRFSQKEALALANELCEMTSARYRILAGATTTPYWVEGSRDQDLDMLDRELEKGTHPMFLWGEGGCGKTETAIQWLIRQKGKGHPVAFVPFAGSMRKTIQSITFSGYHGLPETTKNREEEDYLLRLKMIAERNSGTVFVIDNFDDDEKTLQELQAEPEYDQFLQLPIRVLFMTRFEPHRKAPPLGKMQPEHLVRLFCNASGKRVEELSEEDSKNIGKLIGRVDSHPLTVELMGAMIAESDGDLSIADLLREMKSGKLLDDEDAPEVEIQWNRSREERPIYGHLQKLFRLSRLTESEKNVMRYASLLPVAGMDRDLFRRCAGEATKDAFKRLRKKSWLRVRDDVVSMHPMIREVVVRDLKPTMENCASFLDRLWRSIDQIHPKTLTKHQQIIPVFGNANRMFMLSDSKAVYAFQAASVMYMCSTQLSEAQVLVEYAIKKRNECGDYIGASAAYWLLGSILVVLNKPEEAKIWALRSFGINCFECDHIDLDALCSDYRLLGIASEPNSAESDYATKAALIVSAVALYRSIPALENDLRANHLLDQIFVAPDKDKIIFPSLLDSFHYMPLMEREGLDALTSKLLELRTEAPRNSPFSLDAYIRILEYMTIQRKKTDNPDVLNRAHQFLLSFNNYISARFDFRKELSLDEQKRILVSIFTAMRLIFPDCSCLYPLSNIAIIWGEIAENEESMERRKDALDKYRYYALQALDEAEEKSANERFYPLALLADALMDLQQFESECSKNNAEVERLKVEALHYAKEAIDASLAMPAEPSIVERLRERFRIESGIEFPDHKGAVEPDEAVIRELFGTSESSQEWLDEREKNNRKKRIRNNLRVYQEALRAWRSHDLSRGYEVTFWDYIADERWLDSLLTSIDARPDQSVLLPFHVDRCFRKIIKLNKIRCKRCGKELESAGDYSTHEIKVCECGECAVDGGNFMLVRFLKSPDADVYEELSELEDPEDDS